MNSFNREKLMVAAHRGYSAIYPENTLLSFEKAIALGVDMLEFDLHSTKDGEIVVMHDITLERTTNGKGNVADFTLKEIKKLDAGSKKSPEFAGEEIPTLSELCALVKKDEKLRFNVEFKDNHRPTIDKSIDMLSRNNLLEKCVFTAFDAKVLHYIKDKWNLRTQGFPGEYMQNFIKGEKGTYSKLFAVGIAMKYFKGKENEMRLLSPQLSQDFLNMNIQPWAFCPDDTEMVKQAVQAGAKLVTCNNPVPALEYRK